jgi:hypothetical protein
MLASKENSPIVTPQYTDEFVKQSNDSGDDMDNHLDLALRYLGLEDIDLQRVVIIEEQIEQINLPALPENQETIKKVKSNTRTNTFIVYLICKQIVRMKIKSCFNIYSIGIYKK